MYVYIVLVSNGPSVVMTRLDPEKTVANLIWRGFRDFNLYRVPESRYEELKKDVGNHTWNNTLEELNDEWPVRVIDRDSSRAFANFQLFAEEAPEAKIRNRKQIGPNR
ncbi:hypothetical protein JXA80_01190 [bacterium]|nr:hypothetical protein [candidate division CSSED10-310 bacterium]